MSFPLAVAVSTTTPAENTEPFDRVYRSKAHPGRKHLVGKRCRILGRGSSWHAVLLEFEDGQRVIASARSVKRKKG
jgi:hypothetical protein